ncbi:MAG: hypothetical protein KBG15_21785, partial [Kofleriaceae bacterium]|nr:hypothetical protein [Kofleriaceae bacterium]
TLDSLAVLSFTALDKLYRTASCVNTLRAIDGTPKGRMLAVKTIGASPLGSLVRSFASSSAFIWDGKTFAAGSDDEGTGINRLKVPGALGRQNLFPFNTHLGKSAIDGKRALVLDYDLDENPFWIRKIHDEVRELTPGLFFGPAMWKGDQGPKTLLWFALDTRGR